MTVCACLSKSLSMWAISRAPRWAGCPNCVMSLLSGPKVLWSLCCGYWMEPPGRPHRCSARRVPTSGKPLLRLFMHHVNRRPFPEASHVRGPACERLVATLELTTSRRKAMNQQQIGCAVVIGIVISLVISLFVGGQWRMEMSRSPICMSKP